MPVQVAGGHTPSVSSISVFGVKCSWFKLKHWLKCLMKPHCSWQAEQQQGGKTKTASSVDTCVSQAQTREAQGGTMHHGQPSLGRKASP